MARPHNKILLGAGTDAELRQLALMEAVRTAASGESVEITMKRAEQYLKFLQGEKA